MKKLLFAYVLTLSGLFVQANNLSDSTKTKLASCAFADKCVNLAKLTGQYLTNTSASLTTASSLENKLKTELPTLKGIISDENYQYIETFLNQYEQLKPTAADLRADQMRATLWKTIYEAKAKRIKEQICNK